ncbi:DUF1648 domain-containing protein [bacterium]|nr:DUF1648 domain-containing protein [bacterium]
MRTMVILLILAAMLGIWYYPSLPEEVASHFGSEGEANGWMSRDGFMVLYGFLFLFLAGTFAGSAWLMKVLPDSMINLPRKKYWLAPERRAESIAYLHNSMMRMGNATLLFMLLMMFDTFEANLLPSPRLSPLFWPVLIGYFLYLGWLIWSMFRRFQRKS